jgi:hypothetical protein
MNRSAFALMFVLSLLGTRASLAQERVLDGEFFNAWGRQTSGFRDAEGRLYNVAHEAEWGAALLRPPFMHEGRNDSIGKVLALFRVRVVAEVRAPLARKPLGAGHYLVPKEWDATLRPVRLQSPTAFEGEVEIVSRSLVRIDGREQRVTGDTWQDIYRPSLDGQRVRVVGWSGVLRRGQTPSLWVLKIQATVASSYTVPTRYLRIPGPRYSRMLVFGQKVWLQQKDDEDQRDGIVSLVTASDGPRHEWVPVPWLANAADLRIGHVRLGPASAATRPAPAGTTIRGGGIIDRVPGR